MKSIGRPYRETARYIVNREPMDAAAVKWPPHIEQREGGLGCGDRCWRISCGGADIESGIDAIRDVYPRIQVTANRDIAAAWLR